MSGQLALDLFAAAFGALIALAFVAGIKAGNS